MKEKIIGFVVSQVVPWLKKYVIPVIEKQIKAFIAVYLPQLAAALMKKMKNVYHTYSESKKDKKRYAEEKAEENETHSRQAATESEVEKYKAVAQVWREVAEMYRLDLEEVKRVESTVEEAIIGYNRDVIRGAADVIEKMDVNAIVKENIGELKALPSGKKD